MNGIYVLIVIMVFSHGHSSSTISQEFGSYPSCERAWMRIAENIHPNNIQYIDCVPKGGE